MRCVPRAIPPEPDADREDVGDDREQQQAARGIETTAVSRGFGSDCGPRHAQMDRSAIQARRRRTSIGHALRYPKITRTVPGGAMAARLTVPKMVAASWGNPRVKTG